LELQILPESEYERYGIDPNDVPSGMVVSLNCPPMLEGRYGGNVYGLGAYEVVSGSWRWMGVYEKDVVDNLSYSQLNSLYKKMGLLVRVTKDLKPYYLVPFQIASQFNVEVKFQLQSLSDIISNYKTNHYKQSIRIGVFTDETSVVFDELKARFVDDEIECISEYKISNLFDLLIFPDDFSIWFSRITATDIKQDRKNYRYWLMYVLHKIYRLLREEGNLIFFHKNLSEDDKTQIKIKFQTELEAKRFIIHSKILNTQFSYVKPPTEIMVSLRDLSRYMTDYHKLINWNIERFLTEGKSLSLIQVEEIEQLLTSGYRPIDKAYGFQTELVNKAMAVFFNLIHQEDIFSKELNEFWEKKFVVEGGWPIGFFSYKVFSVRPARSHVQLYLKKLDEDVLRGCKRELVADYRDSFEYVIRVLDTLSHLRHREYPQVLKQYSDRLRLPLESKKRRHRLLEDVLRLQKKKAVLEELRNWVNFQNLDGPYSSIFSNLDVLLLMDFNESEVLEILRIIVGHSAFGRILLGKLHEKRLHPLLEYAKRLDSDEGLNLLRYLRLMTAAELEASLGKPLSASQMTELFELFDRCARYISSPGPDTEYFTHEGDFLSGQALKVTVIKRLLRLMGYHEYLSSPDELGLKGEMELEVLAGFDEVSFLKIRNVRQLVVMVEYLMERFWEKGVGFEEFSKRLMESEFHGTGRLFQLVPPANVLTLLWILLGVSQEKILNLNPVLKGLSSNEIVKRVNKIKKDLRSIDIHSIPWQGIGELKEELYKRGVIFIPGTGFLLSLNLDLGVLVVDYQDIKQDIKKCSTYLEKMNEYNKASIEELNELNTLIKRLTVYQYSLKDIKNYLTMRFFDSKIKVFKYKHLEKLLFLGRNLIFEKVLEPSNISLNFKQIKERYPQLLFHLLGVKEQSLLEKILEAFRMFQCMLIKDVKSFYSPALLERRLQQEFGVGGGSEIGAIEEELLLLSEELDGLSNKKELLKGILLALVGLIKLKEGDQFTQHIGFLAPEFCEALPNHFRNKAIEIFEGAKVILGYVEGTHSLFQVDELRKSSPTFSASFISAFIVTQACESKLISHDFLSKFLYPLIPLPPYQRPILTDPKEYALGRLFRLKGLMYVDPDDVERYIKKAQPRYIMTIKGLKDVGLHNFERELYEGVRIFRGFINLPGGIQSKILELLQRSIIKGFIKISNFLTYENQLKLLGLIAVVCNRNDSPLCNIDLGPLCANIDIAYECINKELNNLSYEKILLGAIPSIFSFEFSQDSSEIILNFNPDIEIANMFRDFDQTTDIEELRTKYMKILNKASEYYVITDRIEKTLDKHYTDRLKAIVQEELITISSELNDIKDFGTLERYKKKTIEAMWNRGVLVKEAIHNVEEVFEKRTSELKQEKITEIRDVLKRINDHERLIEYWGEIKSYLKKNKSVLGQDYLLLVGRLFDATSSKLVSSADKEKGRKFIS